MLVLSRRPGQKILLGNEITLTVLRVGPNTVRLGIDAPEWMNILREEICVGMDDLESREPKKNGN